MKQNWRITTQVLNGATGEIREILATAAADDEQDAVDTIFSAARTDDFYYRFLGRSGVLAPTKQAVPVHYNGQVYFARQ